MEAVSNFLASDLFYRFRKSPVAVVAFVVTVLLVLSAVAGQANSGLLPTTHVTANLSAKSIP